MHHETRHIAVCTCGRSIEIVIRTPRTEEKSGDKKVMSPMDAREDSGTIKGRTP